MKIVDVRLLLPADSSFMVIAASLAVYAATIALAIRLGGWAR